ncbi:MAG: ferrous iron transport protein A [Eubacteriales bacterium]|nr:ferrous iron transport protein A [Eubacteriales bacterium]
MITEVRGHGPLRRRLLDMGLTPGTKVSVIKHAPFGDPIVIRLRGYELSIRKQDAAMILVDRNYKQ